MNAFNKLALPAIVAGAGFLGVGGATLISNLLANADTPTTTSAATSTTAPSSTSSTNSTAQDAAHAAYPGHGTAAEEAAEKPVTGANASKVQAAAVTYVGSGTAGDVTTDYSQSGYEVTVTKSDGSTVELHLDSSFTVTQGGHGSNQ